MPRIPDLDQPLSDGAVILRDAAERDIPEILIAYQDDPQLHLRLRQDRPPSGAQLGRAAETEAADRQAGLRATLSIVEPESDVCRGQVSLFNFDWRQGRAELGIWLAPQARARGLGARALRLVGEWVLGPCGLRRLQLTTQTDNEPMIHAARAAGFSFEGVLREHALYRGRREDSAVFSLLRERSLARPTEAER